MVQRPPSAQYGQSFSRPERATFRVPLNDSRVLSKPVCMSPLTVCAPPWLGSLALEESATSHVMTAQPTPMVSVAGRHSQCHAMPRRTSAAEAVRGAGGEGEHIAGSCQHSSAGCGASGRPGCTSTVHVALRLEFVTSCCSATQIDADSLGDLLLARDQKLGLHTELAQRPSTAQKPSRGLRSPQAFLTRNLAKVKSHPVHMCKCALHMCVIQINLHVCKYL